MGRHTPHQTTSQLGRIPGTSISTHPQLSPQFLTSTPNVNYPQRYYTSMKGSSTDPTAKSGVEDNFELSSLEHNIQLSTIYC